ncbi:MAG TPA: hypothetical protein VK966_13360, partial [Longimicrobiales bacterium]|nr:hypothetical protein [Longimicrobiales bacterium]
MVRRSRALLRVWGRDPVKMIHGLATADIEAVSPDRGTYTVFLSPKGKMVADARIFALADGELLLDTDPAAQEPLLAHLRKFIPPLFARFEDVSGSWAVVGVYGDGATEAAAAGAASLDLGSLPADAREAEDEAVALRKGAEALVVRTREAGGDGWEFFVPAPSVDTLSAALAGAGADPGTGADLDRLRLLA